MNCRRRKQNLTLREELWVAVGAQCDLLAGLLVFAAFEYAPMLQISLLEDASLPLCFLFESLIDKRRQLKLFKCLGALTSTASLFFFGVMQGKRASLGLFSFVLPLTSALLYVCSNIIQARCKPDAYLKRLGLHGFIFSCIYGCRFAGREIKALFSSPKSVSFSLALIVSALLLFYTCLPKLLSHKAGPTFLNLSLASKNVYLPIATLTMMYLGREQVTLASIGWWTWVALVGVTLGLLIYEYDPQKDYATEEDSTGVFELKKTEAPQFF